MGWLNQFFVLNECLKIGEENICFLFWLKCEVFPTTFVLHCYRPDDENMRFGGSPSIIKREEKSLMLNWSRLVHIAPLINNRLFNYLIKKQGELFPGLYFLH